MTSKNIFAYLLEAIAGRGAADEEKWYAQQPDREVRFRTQSEEDEYYQRLWDRHGGSKMVIR